MGCWDSFLQFGVSFGLAIAATICLLVLLFSTPIIIEIDRFHCEVFVDNVFGTLTWGTLGYCLDVSNNKTCSFFPHVIDNAQVLAQVKMVSTEILSILIIVSLGLELIGALGASCSACCSFQRPISCFAGLGVASGLIGLGIDIAFKFNDRSMCHFGTGSYLNFSAFGILASLLAYAITVSCVCMEKEEESSLVKGWKLPSRLEPWHGYNSKTEKKKEEFLRIRAFLNKQHCSVVSYMPEIFSKDANVQISHRVDNSKNQGIEETARDAVEDVGTGGGGGDPHARGNGPAQDREAQLQWESSNHGGQILAYDFE